MAAGFYREFCPNCGNSNPRQRDPDAGNPLGQPILFCPKCGYVSYDGTRKEWLQMTRWEKIRAISPRGGVWAILAAVAPFLLLHRWLSRYLYGGELESVSSSLLSQALELGIYGLLVMLIFYGILLSAVNSRSFLERYIRSVRRTSHRSYRAMLENRGPITGEKLPLGLRFSQQNQKRIRAGLEEPLEYGEMAVPAMDVGENGEII